MVTELVDQNAAGTLQALVKAFAAKARGAAQIDTAETLKVLGKNFSAEATAERGTSFWG